MLIIYTKSRGLNLASYSKNYMLVNSQLGKPDKAIGQIGLDINFQGLQLYGSLTINEAKRWLLIFFSLDDMIIYSNMFWMFC